MTYTNMDRGFIFVLSSAAFCVLTAQGYLPSPSINLNYYAMFSQNANGTYQFLATEHDPLEASANVLFDHHVALAEFKDNVKLSWKIDKGNISFKLSAPAYGWIGLALSRDGETISNADLIVVGITSTGTYYVTDAHITEDGTFVQDESQDVEKQSVVDGMHGIHGIFTRPLVTCDHLGDVDIAKDTMRIFWAYGGTKLEESRPMLRDLAWQEHGQLNLKFFNPPTTQFDHTNMPPDFELESLMVNVPGINVLPSSDRHCLAFRFADIRQKIHITEFQPYVQQHRRYNIRQIIIRECIGMFQGLSESRSQSVDCDIGETEANCSTIVVVWTPSMITFAYPLNVGYPVKSSNIHFLMEIQYRIGKDQGFADSSGMRIHYTTALKEHDAGVLTTGSLVHESQLIPPQSAHFRLQGHCMTECIRMSIPQDRPVKIFTATLRAREAGRKIRVRHFRDGQELAPITADETFRHSDYQTEYIPTHIQLEKGDNMIVECTYNTSGRKEITFVNNSRGGESCLAYLGYYPRNVKLTACETAPTESVIMATVGATRRDEMLKRAKTFAWTKEEIQVYNDKLLENMVYVQCGDSEFDGPQPVPKIANVYTEELKCFDSQSTPQIKLLDSSTQSISDITTSGTIQCGLSMMMAVLSSFVQTALLRLRVP